MTDAFSHNPAKSRYELEVNGRIAFADYQRSGQRLVIPHVEADPALRGTGAAGRLMGKVAETARNEGMKIVPLCSYASAWLRRNDPEMIA
jgi:predicted GNAT family acetyltransferase